MKPELLMYNAADEIPHPSHESVHPQDVLRDTDSGVPTLPRTEMPTDDAAKLAQVTERIQSFPKKLEIVDASSVTGAPRDNEILRSNEGKDFTYKRRIGDFTYSFLFQRDADAGMYAVSFTTDEGRYTLVNQGMREFREIMDTTVEMLQKVRESDPFFKGIRFSGMKENVTQADRDRLSSENEVITSFLVATSEQTPERFGGFFFDDGYGNTLGYGEARLTRTYAPREERHDQNHSFLDSLRVFLSGGERKGKAAVPDTKSFPVNEDVLRLMTTAESIALLRYLGYLGKETKGQETVSRQRKDAYIWYLKRKLPGAEVVEDETSDMVYVYVQG